MAFDHRCRLIIDPPGEGAWNMAVDEALLESAQNDDVATLRFYSWRVPTLSLGYFQSHADRRLHPMSADCPVVRRASGGGAILHDRELTYSIALPHGHLLSLRAQGLYEAVHESLIEALAELGISATRFDGQRRSIDQPFLCFQRREHGDVVSGDDKIAGSAQRRQRGAVLQHGSILLACSRFAPELPGIAELFSEEVNIEDLCRDWLARLAKMLKVSFTQSTLPATVAAAAGEIARQKFGNPVWTQKR
jgi:lipoate-protein ligase A